MKRTVRFLPEALEDLIETQRWYASREPGLEKAFAEAIAEAVKRILQDPASIRACTGGALLRQPPRLKSFRTLAGTGFCKHGAGGTRTHDLRFRKPSLSKSVTRLRGGFA